ncbi:MAG: zinc-ribbon domain-containing protein [Chloroflexi bacterium]|nr:MAG: zinc-ribbon domain-containing protein [Chloroflexota bacterium]
MASQGPSESGGITFCRHCGKAIEADARFCRFCGKAQGEPSSSPAAPSAHNARGGRVPSGTARSTRSADGLEHWLRQLFPRDSQQDEFMHIGSIVAFFLGLIGFVLGFFPAYSWLATNFLLTGIALLLFLILRESTLAQIRARGGVDRLTTPTGGRSASARQPSTAALPPEAATTQSSPVPPAPPEPGSFRPTTPRQ